MRFLEYGMYPFFLVSAGQISDIEMAQPVVGSIVHAAELIADRRI